WARNTPDTNESQGEAVCHTSGRLEERACRLFVGVRWPRMKVLRTFDGDMTTFTTLLRELSHSGDAPGRMTYDDSGARPSERRVTKSERSRGRLVSDVDTTSLE